MGTYKQIKKHLQGFLEHLYWTTGYPR